MLSGLGLLRRSRGLVLLNMSCLVCRRDGHEFNMWGLLKYHRGKTDKLVLNWELGSVGGLYLCVIVEVVLFLFGPIWVRLFEVIACV